MILEILFSDPKRLKKCFEKKNQVKRKKVFVISPSFKMQTSQATTLFFSQILRPKSFAFLHFIYFPLNIFLLVHRTVSFPLSFLTHTVSTFSHTVSLSFLAHTLSLSFLAHTHSLSLLSHTHSFSFLAHTLSSF